MRFSPAPVLSLLFLLITPASSQIVYSGLWNIPIPLNFEGVYLDIDTGNTGSTEMFGWDLNIFFGGVAVAASERFQPGRLSIENDAPIQRIDAGTVITAPPSEEAARMAWNESSSMVVTKPPPEEGDEPENGPYSLMSETVENQANGSDQSMEANEVSLVTLQYAAGPTGSATHLGAPGNFQDGVEGYFGFRFLNNEGDGFYYGWMRVTLTANTTGGVIHDWAWESSGAPIAAGQIPEPSPVPLTILGVGVMLFLKRSRRGMAR
ncbi:MAG: PEP-CTERM sorting domain-containing protein [Verrucomicrobiaceae bacterium]|nr:MAG: PEP-CTERM sorting domain-containing protein [Verrucomicrobiaceae bacterium]